MSVRGGPNVNDWSYRSPNYVSRDEWPRSSASPWEIADWAGFTAISSLGAALGVGVVSFLATELMHYCAGAGSWTASGKTTRGGLVRFHRGLPDREVGKHQPKATSANQARMQVIAEMNHHIRNAMTSISLSVQVKDESATNSGDLRR